MAANFVSASSQHIQNAASPITDYPFTVGMWVRPADVTGDKFFFELSGGTNQVTIMRSSTSYIIECVTQAIAGTAVANSWSFIVARLISATNRRLAVLNPTGSTAHAQDTGSAAIAGATTMDIGGGIIGVFWNGMVAEFWYTKTDIQPDGGQLADITLRHLAYNGPFSIPYIAKDIVEYRSFISSCGSRDVEPGEVYWGSRGKQVWATTGTPTIGLHPPLLSPYRRPTDYHRMMMI